jgi:hypothetical protein
MSNNNTYARFFTPGAAHNQKIIKTRKRTQGLLVWDSSKNGTYFKSYYKGMELLKYRYLMQIGRI